MEREVDASSNDLHVIKVMRVDTSERTQVPLPLASTLADLRFVLDRRGFAGRYETTMRAPLCKGANSEGILEDETMSVILIQKTVLLEKKHFKDCYVLVREDCSSMSKEKSRYLASQFSGEPIEYVKGQVLRLSHQNLQAQTGVVFSGGPTTDRAMYLRFVEPISCVPSFVEQMRSRCQPAQEGLLALPFDVLRIVFLLLDDLDFLRFRLSSPIIFLATFRGHVRNRVNVLAARRWTEYIQ